MLDVRFSDSAESNAPGSGGFVDDNGGLDYHINISGATGVMATIKVWQRSRHSLLHLSVRAGGITH
jgi:hypothetical protein